MNIDKLHSVSELKLMAEAISSSGLFGIKSAQQALGLMLICQAEGLHPAVAARDYHVINGRASLKTDAMMARFQHAGGKVEWLSYQDDEVSANFSHPSGGEITVTWTIEQAKRAGLTGKDVWKQYPRAMLRARVISEGIRTVFPGVVVGVYTPEEAQDFDTAPAVSVVPDFDVAPQRAASNSSSSTSATRTLTERVADPVPFKDRGELITKQQTIELAKIVKAAGFDQTDEGKRQARDWLAWILGVEVIESVLTLTKKEADSILSRLTSKKAIEDEIGQWYEHLNSKGLPGASND